ncbi:MAG: DUF72 domain-containing protein [Bacteriovoracia bacterium]
MTRYHIGMSGWTFPGWRKKFYPKDLVQKKELFYASRQLNSLEINGTFYGLQKPATFQNWFDETPDDFVFSVKATQYITHVHRLKEVLEPLATFLGSGLLCLKNKLGPILWQFPPNFTLKDDRVEKFLKILPRDSKSAAKLAKKHGYKIEGKYFYDVKEDFPIRHAFEFRHKSYYESPHFLELLRHHNAAFVLTHSSGLYIENITADFIYARMGGEGKEYSKGYPDKTLNWWYKRLRTWEKGKQPKDAILVGEQKKIKKITDTFIYFGTEKKVFAPQDALNLSKKLLG